MLLLLFLRLRHWFRLLFWGKPFVKASASEGWANFVGSNDDPYPLDPIEREAGPNMHVSVDDDEMRVDFDLGLKQTPIERWDPVEDPLVTCEAYKKAFETGTIPSEDPWDPPTPIIAKTERLGGCEMPCPSARIRRGIVSLANNAFSYHRRLVLRPDDVWFSVMTQLSCYVNGNAERLRHNFVNHEGKVNLTVARVDRDWAAFVDNLVELIRENVRSKGVADMLLPVFSTTTSDDRVCSMICTMSTLKAFFDYEMVVCCCGLPGVTLKGTVNDWKKLLRHIKQLASVDPWNRQYVEWIHSLTIVVGEMLASRRGRPNNDFWQRIYTYNGGSGSSSVTGWITIFSMIDAKGKISQRTYTVKWSRTGEVKACTVESEDDYMYSASAPVLVKIEKAPGVFEEFDAELVAGWGRDEDAFNKDGSIAGKHLWGFYRKAEQ